MSALRFALVFGLVVLCSGCAHWPTERQPVGSTSDGRVDSYWSGTPWSLPAFTGTGLMTYTVEKGDTLSKIARRHDTTVAKLVELNALGDANNLAAGMVLYLDTTRGKHDVARRVWLRRHRRVRALVQQKSSSKAHVKYPMRWPVTGNVTTKFGKKKAGRLMTGSISVHPKEARLRRPRRAKLSTRVSRRLWKS